MGEVALHGLDPLSSEFGTNKAVKARLWPLISGNSTDFFSSCSLFARKRAKCVLDFLRTPVYLVVYDSGYATLQASSALEAPLPALSLSPAMIVWPRALPRRDCNDS